MGCWDIFCFLCGNTCHSTLNGIDEYLIENIEYYESNNKKFKMFKPIYENNKIVHGCKEVTCNNTFKDKNGNSYSHSTGYEYDDIMYGVFIHTDCWKFIKNEYNIKLTYSHLPIIENNILSPKIFPFINYGIIEKYWQQDFDFIRTIAESNEELCNSPLKSNLIAKNIKKIISKLKIKSDTERKGPIVSATFYKNGLYKVGINGNIWVTKNNKWNEIKDTIKLKTNKIKNIVYSADVNDKPIFVLKNNSNKKINEYDILTVK